MPSLNHVCMWTENGWKSVTAEEASKVHPGGTVSASLGLFMCDLCGQKVCLTNEKQNSRHFKHSSKEADKNCPERTFGSNNSLQYNPEHHDLPIKLVMNSSGFGLELGFLSVPQYILDKYNSENITIKTDKGREIVFLFERLKTETITYLPLGNELSTEYKITVPQELSKYWPQRISGISKKGAIFDYRTGKMLPKDSDVNVNKKYYLLSPSTFNLGRYFEVKLTLVCEQSISLMRWRLYEIESTEINRGTIEFFMNLNYRLTDTPLKMQPIWPVYIKTPYLIKQNQNDMIIHISANRQIIPKTFPNSQIQSRLCPEKGNVIKVCCNDYQQLITLGISNVLQYLYIRKETHTDVVSDVKIKAFDGKNKIFIGGRQNLLPEGNTIIITAPYDGTIVLRKSRNIIKKINIKASSRTIINNIQYDMSVQVMQGLDTIWQTSFIKVPKEKSSKDLVLYNHLVALKGNEVYIPHCFGAIAARLKDYPKTKQWISASVGKGYMSEKAIKYLKKYVIDLSFNKDGEE